MINQYLADDTVASLLQIMDYIGSLESSRDLQPIHEKSFVNRLHLVLQINKIPFHFNAFTTFLQKPVKI